MEWRVWITWCIIFCIRYSRLLYIYLKKHEAVTDNHSVITYVNKIKHRITFEIKIRHSIITYVNKIKNRITLKMKIGYYLEVLMPETMKMLGSTKSK